MIPPPPPNLAEWLVLIGLIIGALTGLGTWFWGHTIEPRLTALQASLTELCNRLRVVEYEITPNGARRLLPEHLRDYPFADLLVTHIIETAPLIAEHQRERREREERRQGAPTEGV